MSNEIDPDRVYSMSEAASLFPSPRRGTQTAVSTLHAWRRAGRLSCISRGEGRYRYWFVRGSEIIRFLSNGQDTESRRCGARDEAAGKARRELKFLGLNTDGRDSC